MPELEAFLDRLFRQNEFAIKLGLDPIRQALALQGHPDQNYRIVLVAGTNGKGMVASLLAAFLQAAGLRVGLFSSPHLIHFGERIRVQGKPIDQRALLALGKPIFEAFAEPNDRPGLTFFELSTLMALEYFAQSKVDWAVLEVGLGGRLDATNATHPVLSVITEIGLDHQKYLGQDLHSIAREKAGILRAQRPAVIGALEAREVLVREAHQRKALPWVYGLDFKSQVQGSNFEFQCKDWGWELELKTFWAPFQLQNLAIALGALSQILPQTSLKSIQRGLDAWQWPGRFQVLTRNNGVWVLDGAHNPLGTLALIQALEQRFGQKPWTLVFAVMADKDWPSMLKLWIQAGIQRWILPKLQSARALEPSRLARTLNKAGVLEVREVSQTCMALKDPGSHLVIAGSLYLVGEALTCLGVCYQSLKTYVPL